MPEGVVALRDLADAAVVAAAVEARQRILVLGGGVLGVEAALGIAAAGAEVILAHHGLAPMERQLDSDGGRMLSLAAQRAGVMVLPDAVATQVVTSSGTPGRERFRALRCRRGDEHEGPAEEIPADLLVLSVGVVPRTELAADAGLSTASGILVDADQRTWDDRYIFAIGDCAQVAAKQSARGVGLRIGGGPSGLIGPGWRQAEHAAAVLAAEAAQRPLPQRPSDKSPSPAVMVKAEGIDVVAAGDVAVDPWESIAAPAHARHSDACAVPSSLAAPQVSQWADPARSGYVKIITVDDVLTGFVSIGMPRVGAELTQLYLSGAELPHDRTALLRLEAPDLTGAAADRFAPGAVVCWCNGVSVAAVTDAVAAGDRTVACVGASTRAGTGCGGCKERIAELIERIAVTQPLDSGVS